LWEDSDVSEEHAASIFKVEACVFKNRFGYIGKLDRRWSWDPRKGGEEKEPGPSQLERWTKKYRLWEIE
jgi:hypothetical protein